MHPKHFSVPVLRTSLHTPLNDSMVVAEIERHLPPQPGKGNK